MRFRVVVAMVLLAFGAAHPARAEDISTQIEAARAALGKGDQLRALSALQAATMTLNGRLTDQCVRFLPTALNGWDTTGPEGQALDGIGGGLTVTRNYAKGSATLSATLIIDNPAVDGAASLFRSLDQLPNQSDWSRVKFGAEDAVLRFDSATHSGEITMVIGGRALLQIEGTEINRNDVLLELAKGWHLAGIRKFVGVGS